jgi:RNA polymerase sigma factor (sigma-70 family)
MSERDGDAATFRPTRWSLVARAASPADATAPTALEELCRAYWYPLYAFLRRRGRAPEDAEDLVQGFFAGLLERGALAQADPARGRFRTFLLAALLHHASHEREKAGAAKRGGRHGSISLDALDAEQRYALEPAGGETAEALFERRWALETLERALARVAEEARAGAPEAAERHAALVPLLWGEGGPQHDVAVRLGLSATALRVALHRLRVGVREALRREVRETLSDPADLDDELARLAAALRASGSARGA